MKQQELSTSCTLRLRPETTEQQVRDFLQYLFDGDLEQDITEDIVAQFKEFKADKCYGRLTYNVTTLEINLKEDNKRL